MKVLKFGGTSLVDSSIMKKVSKIISKYNNAIIVVSALGGVTDELIRAAKLAELGDEEYKTVLKEIHNRHNIVIKDLKLNKNVKDSLKKKINELELILKGIGLTGEASNRSLDFIMSFGEYMSALIFSDYINSEFVDSRDIIKTDENFGRAKVDFKKTEILINNRLKDIGRTAVVTGFVGLSDNGETTTLGRGGSDYTASIIANALDADEIEIWTDVDGIMTADPRIVRSAYSLNAVSYKEAIEMSHFGAKVIYAPTIQPALIKNIPIKIKNTYNPGFIGSLISDDKRGQNIVSGISATNEVSLIKVQGSAMVGKSGQLLRVFRAMSDVNIIFVSYASSEYSVCLAVSHDDVKRSISFIEEEFYLEIELGQVQPPEAESDLSVVAIVGDGMTQKIGVAAKMFKALANSGINIVAIAQSSSERNISVVIKQEDKNKALNTLHDSFFPDIRKRLNVFILGTGLIGSALIRQILDSKDSLYYSKNIDINIVGISNSKKMMFFNENMNEDWQKVLKRSAEKANANKFVEKIKELDLPNSVFVDCTASGDLVKTYLKAFKLKIPVVTANKKVNSSFIDEYNKVMDATVSSDTRFFYETNVGAGLPVIQTLKDLIASGDEIIKIEAVLSGTLSYIFNEFSSTDREFFEIVKDAKAKGYTEPDPRDDLNGMDVARKILILAREAGSDIEIEDISINKFMPDACEKASNVDDFFKKLKEKNAAFEKLRDDAKKNNAVLRYIASFESGYAETGLKAVGPDHPFYSLSGSDNIIMFKTKRYNDYPLVVRGPGAGAEVTAGGVFADIIKVIK